MAIDPKMINKLLKDYKRPEEILGKGGLLKQFTKAVVERMIEAEMSNHLGYDRYASQGRNKGNSHNRHSKKNLKGEFGEIEINVPRDRHSEFEPLIVPKGQTRFDGF